MLVCCSRFTGQREQNHYFFGVYHAPARMRRIATIMDGDCLPVWFARQRIGIMQTGEIRQRGSPGQGEPGVTDYLQDERLISNERY